MDIQFEVSAELSDFLFDVQMIFADNLKVYLCERDNKQHTYN